MSVKNELHSKYRPKKLKNLVGQDTAVKMLTSMKGKYPHALLFTGPSGTGKTTLARIIKDELGCSELDYTEINAASARGVDTIREIAAKMYLAPMGGKCRVYCLDECHRLTNDAQSALLKMLEDPPSSAYFMLATTDPQKLLPTIRTRCTTITCKSVNEPDLIKLATRIRDKEGLEISDEVIEKLAENADGSPRRLVVTLGSISELEDEADQIEAIERADEKKQAFDLCRFLMRHRGAVSDWPGAAEIIKSIPDSEIESFRRMVLAYATSCLIGAKDRKPPKTPNKHAYQVILAFSDPFFDSGRAGLTAACCDVIFGE